MTLTCSGRESVRAKDATVNFQGVDFWKDSWTT